MIYLVAKIISDENYNKTGNLIDKSLFMQTRTHFSSLMTLKLICRQRDCTRSRRRCNEIPAN